jgi:hypothetical protein
MNSVSMTVGASGIAKGDGRKSCARGEVADWIAGEAALLLAELRLSNVSTL